MAENGDMKAHEQTYAGVMTLIKWGTVVSFVVAVAVVILIAN